jgi:hypothetical protein
MRQVRNGVLKCDRTVPRLFRDVFRERRRVCVSGCWPRMRGLRLTHARSWSSIPSMEAGSLGVKASRKAFEKLFAKVLVGPFQGDRSASACIDVVSPAGCVVFGEGSPKSAKQLRRAFSKSVVEISPTCRWIAVRLTVREDRSRDSAVRLPGRNRRSRRAGPRGITRACLDGNRVVRTAHRCSDGEDVHSGSA